MAQFVVQDRLKKQKTILEGLKEETDNPQDFRFALACSLTQQIIEGTHFRPYITARFGRKSYGYLP